MHRHGYQGRKLSREAGPRRALIRGLMTSLTLYEKITTTEAKAKELVPHFDRLITRAKRATLADKRLIHAELLTEGAARKMLVELAPAFAERNGGYTRIIKLENRMGDNAPMVLLQLILPEKRTVAKVDEVATDSKEVVKPATKPVKARKAAVAAGEKK
jgi:large subunit ribosomal protein L17